MNKYYNCITFSGSCEMEIYCNSISYAKNNHKKTAPEINKGNVEQFSQNA